MAVSLQIVIYFQSTPGGAIVRRLLKSRDVGKSVARGV